MSDRETIRDSLLELARQRGPEKTLCPSEVARALREEDWRELMDDVREVAFGLADEGEIVIKQKGVVVAHRSCRGPIRIAIVEQT